MGSVDFHFWQLSVIIGAAACQCDTRSTPQQATLGCHVSSLSSDFLLFPTWHLLYHSQGGCYRKDCRLAWWDDLTASGNVLVCGALFFSLSLFFLPKMSPEANLKRP